MSRWWLRVLILAAVAIWVAALTLPDDKLHVVFCDVGQGDAILIYKGTTQMLVDGGPNDRVLGCLSTHMPFYDHQIEVMILTHPQADHLQGLISVAERYSILYFVSGPEGNETVGFKDLQRQITSSKSQITNVYSGDKLSLGEIRFKVVWPERSFVAQHVTGQDKVLGMATDGTDLNSFSIGGIVSFGQFDVLLTGDADRQVASDQLATGLLRDVEVLKVPHHGSKTGMTTEWLEAVAPDLAVISVGKNSYGHPTEEVLKMLRERDMNISPIRILRTDMDGEVEVVSDGVKWWVNEDRN